MITSTESLFAQLGIPAPSGTDDPVTRSRELEERSKILIHENRLADFKAKCPEEFRATINRDLLPNLKAWDAADKWKPGSYPGIWLWSPETGRGKTRMLWRKVGQAMVQLGKRHIYITGAHLGEWYYECFRNGEPSEFYRRFGNHDLVVLDDIDKYPLTDERAARAFREMWDYFYNRHVSVMVSANEPPEFVGQRVGQSALRRVLEVCRPTQF